ncbi:unnamed protein product, partial [Rotaria sp. Silwood2]
MEFGFEDTVPNDDEVFASQQLFKILKTCEDSYFNELHTYQTLDFHDEYDEMTDEDETTDEDESNDEEENIADYDENQSLQIRNNFTLEEMQEIVEWVDQHPTLWKVRKVSLEILIYWSYCDICILSDAYDWIRNQRSLILNYYPHEILNSDHCSFQQEYISPRTLSFTGERTTEVVVKKKNNVTHSYTVQPITSADGQLLDKFFLILQEKENEFGKRVERDLIVPPNVVVRASKSGKSSGEKHRIFLKEVLHPLVGRKFLLFLDYWPTQTDMKKFRAVFPHQDSQLLIFPKGTTGFIQPQDLSLFRAWRFIHKKIEHYVHINRTEMNLNDRQYFINMHSAIHNQLSAPQFKNLIRSGFIQAKILNQTVGEIKKPKDVCFKFYDLYCSVVRCGERTLLTCAWCKRHLCYYHLIEDLHLH